MATKFKTENTFKKITFDEVVDCLESDECFETKCNKKGNIEI